jgi:hypothetical protein
MIMRPLKMRRLQIYLDPKMDAHLRCLSVKTGKPKAELIRDGIGLLDIVGIGGKAGYPDASERHDDYLYVMENQ